MKFQNQARLCLAIFDFEVHIILSLCLIFQGTGNPVWENKNLTPMSLRIRVNPLVIFIGL